MQTRCRRGLNRAGGHAPNAPRSHVSDQRRADGADLASEQWLRSHAGAVADACSSACRRPEVRTCAACRRVDVPSISVSSSSSSWPCMRQGPPSTAEGTGKCDCRYHAHTACGSRTARGSCGRHAPGPPPALAPPLGTASVATSARRASPGRLACRCSSCPISLPSSPMRTTWWLSWSRSSSCRLHGEAPQGGQGSLHRAASSIQPGFLHRAGSQHTTGVNSTGPGPAHNWVFSKGQRPEHNGVAPKGSVQHSTGLLHGKWPA